MINPMLNMPGGVEWLIILAIVVLIFGAAKLPELARSSGQALRIFKDETKNLKDDDKRPEAEREIEARNAQAEAQDRTSGEVLRERRDDTTA
jgi:sec-independent protein translocase protein TatA